MKDTITSHKIYAPWEYDKEEMDLNIASEKGLQLKKGGCFSSKFYRNNQVRYIYQLDYNTKIDDPLQYRETFMEQGWEYINSTYNGWHYFRKLYREGMTESESHIYTDKQSLFEMQSRWIRLIGVFSILYFIMAIFYLIMGVALENNLILVEGFIFVMFCLTFSVGILNVLRKRKEKKALIAIPIQIAFPLAMIILIAILVIDMTGIGRVIHEENFKLINTQENSSPWIGGEFYIEKEGTYTLNLDFSNEGGMATIVIQDSDGTVVYENTADNCIVDDWELELKEGNYQTFYSFTSEDQSQNMQVSVDLEISK